MWRGVILAASGSVLALNALAIISKLRNMVPKTCRDLPELELLMSWREKAAFSREVKQVKNFEKSYFEWGTGGSTTVAPPWFKRAFSVENQPEWCSKMTQLPILTCLAKIEQHRYICEAPRNVTGNFGWPLDGDEVKYGGYINMMEQVVKEEREVRGIDIDHFDVVFIDGRFRVACGLAALKYMNEESLLMIHDFNRPYYQVLREVYDVERMVKTLAFLRKKRGVNDERVNALKIEYRLIAG